MPGTISASNCHPSSCPHIVKKSSNLNACAKLVTINKYGRKDALILDINKPVVIGRNPAFCTYVLSDSFVSSIHCKIYTIYSSTGGIIVSCHDMSTNGIILNGHSMHRASVILMDGDIIEIPNSQTFKCVHIWKERPEKENIFDPTPSSQVSYRHIGAYTVTSHCLGSGSFAIVHLAMDTYNHRQVACKMIRTRKDEEMKKVWTEVRILMALNHPNINKVYDVEVSGRNMQIFLQLCTGGDLFTYITSHTDSHHRLVEGEAKYIMYQLFKGLAYLHDKMISHRDLKPENLLLFSPGPYPRILIADFGLARPKAYQETLNVCGTVQYLPPEGILALENKNLGYVGMPADCWSAGVILYVMLSGIHPFDYDSLSRCTCSTGYSKDGAIGQGGLSQCSQYSASEELQAKKRIVDGAIKFPLDIWADKPNAKGLASRLLAHSPLHRTTVQQALHSTWITENILELEKAYQERIDR